MVRIPVHKYVLRFKIVNITLKAIIALTGSILSAAIDKTTSFLSLNIAIAILSTGFLAVDLYTDHVEKSKSVSGTVCTICYVATYS